MELVKQQASSKRRLKLGDIAEHLQVKKFVIRTWEKELGLAPQSGFYGAEDVEIFKKIKQLVLVDRQPLQKVRGAIGVHKLEDPLLSAAQALEPIISLEAAAEAEAMECSVEAADLICEAAESQVSQIIVIDNSVQACSQSEACDEPLVEVFVELEACEQFVAAAACQEEEVGAGLEMATAALVGDRMMIAPAELCEAMTEPQAMTAEQVLSEQVQQKFLAELTFFRQELLKFQQLLNT